ncbi:hypothetical protein H4S08_004865 [Coemansia sp. RSA 1365]|nr:hypothetical protein H4S08_004865 [Coemansia sp. RSA 1365]
MTEHVSATPRSVLTTKEANREHMEAVYSMALPSETDCLSDMEDEEDEVFFGPMSTVELKKLHKYRDIHRRSTQVMQMTPLENTEKSQDTVGAEKIQALFRGALARKKKTKLTDTIGQCVTPEASPMPINIQQQKLQAVVEMQRFIRGVLARRVYCRRREELRFLAVKGTISVERRRRIRPIKPLEEIPQTAPVGGLDQPLPLLRDTTRSPLRRGLSIRNWFQRQQNTPDSAPPLSNSKQQQPPLSETSSIRTNPLKVNSTNTTRTSTFLLPFRRTHFPDKHSASALETTHASGGRARRYLGRLLAQLRPRQTAAVTPTAESVMGRHQSVHSKSLSDTAQLSLHRRSNSRSAVQQAVLPVRLHERRHRHRYQRSRGTIVSTPVARRQRRGAGSSSFQSIDNLPRMPPPVPLPSNLPTNNTTLSSTTDTSLLYESHILLVPLESALPDTVDYNISQQQPFSGNVRRLRSPPPLHQPASTSLQSIGTQLVDSDTQSAPQSPGIGKHAGTKLSMLKSGLGSLLTKPLSPRVGTSRFQSHIPLPGVRGDSAIRSEPMVRTKIPAPIPVRRGLTPIMRSDVELNNANTSVDLVYADMPLSAVGGATFKSALRMAGSDTDEESGIAATVSRIAPSAIIPPSTSDFISTKAFDDVSVSSISSMSASSALESPLSPVSNISANHMDVSPPASSTSIGFTSQQSSDPVTAVKDSLPTLKQKPKLDLSPRLSLRLSTDAATFGTGLSVFASLLDDVRQHSTQDSAVDSSLSDITTAAKGDDGEKSKLENIEECGDVPVSIAENDMDDSVELPAAEDCGSPSLITESSAMDCELSDANVEPQPTETESPVFETEPPANNSVTPAAEAETSAVKVEQPVQVQKQSDMAADASEKTNPALERLRSLRTRRQREKGESVTPTAAATRRFRATQKATAGSSGIKERPLAQMGALQLDRLTKLNTRRNSTYMTCQIERVVEIREGDRPPSPSLMMQLRAQERRMMSGANDSHSIYSSDSDDCDAMSLCSNVDSEMYEDTRPLSPEPTLNSSIVSGCTISAAELPDALHMESSDVKRKSTDLTSSDSSQIALNELDESTIADAKKLCRRKNRLRWGTRSVLQASWLLGNGSSSLRPAPSSLAARNTELSSILVHRTADAFSQPPDSTSSNIKSKRQSKNLEVIKVSCIEYPHSTTDALLDMEDSDEDISSPDTNDEEYIPRRSTRK